MLQIFQSQFLKRYWLKVELGHNKGDVDSGSGSPIVVVTHGVVINVCGEDLHGDLLRTIDLADSAQHQDVSTGWSVSTEVLASTQYREVVPMVDILLEGQVCNGCVGRIVVEQSKFVRCYRYWIVVEGSSAVVLNNTGSELRIHGSGIPFVTCRRIQTLMAAKRVETFLVV